MSASKQKGTASLAERLWSRVDKQPNGCWVFTGYCHPTRGYGQMGRGGRSDGLIETHRAAWVLTHGEIPAGMFVCHRCDNPPCCNPEHLFLGTHADNMRDMKAKGRGRGAAGLTNANARLTPAQVQSIRERRLQGESTKALASEFGVTPQYIGQLARGKWRKSA